MMTQTYCTVLHYEGKLPTQTTACETINLIDSDHTNFAQTYPY